MEPRASPPAAQQAHRGRLGTAPSLLDAFFTQNMPDVSGLGHNGISLAGLREGRQRARIEQMFKKPITGFISVPAPGPSSAPNAVLMLSADVVPAARSHCRANAVWLCHSGSQEGDPMRHKARTTAAEPQTAARGIFVKCTSEHSTLLPAALPRLPIAALSC